MINNDKEYYKFLFSDMIIEIDKGKTTIKKSIQLLLESITNIQDLMRRDEDLMENIRNSKRWADGYYPLFDNLYLENVNGCLIPCSNFTVRLVVDKKEKEINIDYINFYCSLEEGDFHNFYKLSDTYYGRSSRLNFSYTDESEILDIIHESFEKILYELLFEKNIKIYLLMYSIGITEIKDYSNFFTEITDEKTIKNFLIKKGFR